LANNERLELLEILLTILATLFYDEKIDKFATTFAIF